MIQFLIGLIVGGVFTFVMFIIWGVEQEEKDRKDDDDV